MGRVRREGQVPQLRPLFVLAALALIAVGVSACGEEPKVEEHGLTVRGSPAEPTGDAVACQFRQETGAAWIGRLEARFELSVEEGPPGSLIPRQGYTIDAELEIRQERSSETESAVTFRFLRADSPAVDESQTEGEARGRFEHVDGARPDASTLTLQGKPRAQASTFLRSFMLAGFGGSPCWLPNGHFQQGQDFDLLSLGKPMALQKLEADRRRPGEHWPEARTKGGIRVIAIREVDGEQVADLEIDALIELVGTVTRTGGRKTEVQMGEHVTGTATVSLVTGLPQTLDVHRERKVEQLNEGVITREHMQARVSGTIERTEAGG